MPVKRLWISTGLLFIAAVLIRFFCLNSFWVEKWYSTGIYLPISAFLRYIFGWLPFSLGDVFYILLVIWLIWKSIQLLRNLFSKKFQDINLRIGLLRFFRTLCIVYIVFNILWGINYNRKGIGWQLQLNSKSYSPEDLETMNGLLVQKVNESKKVLLNHPQDQLTDTAIFRMAENAYVEAQRSHDFLQYKPAAIKSSLWGWLGNYLGVTGYYNPFSGEAQVNTGVPDFIQPYTTCHEIAHQLGYAKENEANFVGYLAAASSKDTLFLYSVYLDLFTYSNQNLFRLDSAMARKYAKELMPEVKADIKKWREFNLKHRSFFEPAFRWLYGKYLQSNHQPSGVLTYDEVTGFLIAYYKKFGKI